MAFLLDLLNARPGRRAIVRTRRTVDEILDSIRNLANDPFSDEEAEEAPDGYFVGGAVGKREFLLDYYLKGRRNPRPYTVHGVIKETPDWRVVRLKIGAQSPWLGTWGLVLLVAYVAYDGYRAGWSIGAQAWFVAGVVVLTAVVNVLWSPDVVTRRASRIIANEIHGSVFEDGSWVVPHGVQSRLNGS